VCVNKKYQLHQLKEVHQPLEVLQLHLPKEVLLYYKILVLVEHLLGHQLLQSMEEVN
jgi:hypothetical protein